MKIRFTNKQLNYYLIFGTLYVAIGILAIVFDSNNLVNYLWILLGIIHIGIYLFENNKQYLTIENGIITKNQLNPKKLNLTEIKCIRKFAGDYILKTDKEELIINTQIIDPDSLMDLNTELKKLNVEWN